MTNIIFEVCQILRDRVATRVLWVFSFLLCVPDHRLDSALQCWCMRIDLSNGGGRYCA
jgi:hypothetical protein